MKHIAFLMFLLLPFSIYGQEKKTPPATLKSILLEQLKTTHNDKDWFVPATSRWKD